MKQIHRFFVPAGSIKKLRFLLEDATTVKHMRVVLRLKKGDKIELFDGEGKEYDATIGFLTTEQAAGVVDGEKDVTAKIMPPLFLAQSLPRAGKLDEVIRMNTEIGVQGFILFESEYSIAKKETYGEDKMARLARVSTESLRQSEGLINPDFYGPMTFAEALDFKADLKILLHSRLTEGAVDLHEFKKQMGLDKITIMYIGPEGGFSPKELKLAAEKGVQVGYLKLPILRTETASAVASGILLS